MSNLRQISLPKFSNMGARPEIPRAIFAQRCDEFHALAKRDWLLIYADREHCGNLLWLGGIEPRFEEVIFLLGPKSQRVMLLGNECYGHALSSPLQNFERLLVPSLSLMGQQRITGLSVTTAFAEAGLKKGDHVGVVGWKTPGDVGGASMLPYATVKSLEAVVGDTWDDVTSLLVHPDTGLRARITVHDIAAHEWAGQRTNSAVWNIIDGITVGETETEATARIAFAGESLSCNVMVSSSGADHPLYGMASPSLRQIARGDGMMAGFGIWGSLTARGGLVDDGNAEFQAMAENYFQGLAAWYETADIGVAAGDVVEAVVSTLAQGDLKSMLNPGHLIGYEEWLNSPFTPRSDIKLQSAMAIQVDIIPTPVPSHWALNCEDGVVLADTALQAELARLYPDVASRITARQHFIKNQLGINLKQAILPLADRQLCLAPFWLKPHHLVVRH